MLVLILLILLALIIGYVATFNTVAVPISLVVMSFENVPLYIIILVSFLLGIIISYIVSLFDIFSTKMKVHGKNKQLHKQEDTIESLREKVHELEVENMQLKTALDSNANIEHDTRDDDAVV